MTPVVSVIIPSYNHEKFVKECIESVLNQTFQDFEIIITDDRSTDRTVEIIRSFKDPRIKLFVHSQNKGACVAANNCLRHSKGRYIAMLSSDDAWYPHKLAVQVKYMEVHPHIAAVFGRVHWIDENGNLITQEGFPYKHLFDGENRTRYEWLGHFFRSGNRLCHPTSLIRKEMYDEVGWLNPSFANLPDFDLWVRMCLKYDIMILDEQLIRYRWLSDSSNASSNTKHSQIRIHFEWKQILDHFLKIMDPEELLAIFPEASNYGKVTTDTIPYFLGRIAMETGLDLKVLWGQDTIFACLQNEKTAQTMEEKCNFTYLDFINLTKENDVYHLEMLQTLSDRVAEQEQSVQVLKVQAAKKELAVQALTTQLAEIRNSIAWKIVLPLHRIGISLAPPDSLRAKILRRFARILILPFLKIGESRRIKKGLALIHSSDLFDKNWYLANNPDVREARLDPMRHYLLFGGFEGRDPGPNFSSAWYLDTYKDVKIARINPLVHFLEKGLSEGRATHSNQPIQEPSPQDFKIEQKA